MSGTVDELSTKNPVAEQPPPPLQAQLERAATVHDTKMPQIQIKDLKTMYAQVVNELNRMTASAKEYDQRNRTNTFGSKHPSNHEHTPVKMAYWALVEQEKELSALLISKGEQVQKATTAHSDGYKAYFQSLGPVAADSSSPNPSPYKPPHLIRLEKAQIQVAMKKQELIGLRYAYAQARNALDNMAAKVEKDDERNGTDSSTMDASPAQDQVQIAERKQTYRSSIEKQQKMYEALMEKDIGFQNALLNHEQEIYRYYEKEFAGVRVEIRELRKDWRIESRDHEKTLYGFQTKTLQLFFLFFITNFFISLNQYIAWLVAS